MGRVWGDVWASFKAVFGPILTGAAFLLALLGPLYVPNAKVQVGIVWLAVTGLGALTVVLTMGNLILVARHRAHGRLPKVLHASVPETGEEALDAGVTLVMEASNLFGVNIFVTIYYTEPLDWGADEVFERAIGIGRVANVQQNGLVQVLVLRETLNHPEIWQRIRRRDTVTLSQLVIKPSIAFSDAGIEVRFNE